MEGHRWGDYYPQWVIITPIGGFALPFNHCESVYLCVCVSLYASVCLCVPLCVPSVCLSSFLETPNPYLVTAQDNPKPSARPRLASRF